MLNAFTHYCVVVVVVVVVVVQDVVYSGSHNKVHVWKASGDFSMLTQMSTSYGAIYSLAVTRKLVIVGEWMGCQPQPLS